MFHLSSKPAQTLLLLLPALSACKIKTSTGTDSGSNVEVSSKKETYRYTMVSDCSTGDQQFSSHAALCDGLKNEELNRGCSREMREARFKQEGCGGEFSPQPTVSSVSSRPSVPVSQSNEDLAASAAFTRSYANGRKELRLKDALVKIHVKDTINQQGKRNYTLRCTSITPMSIEGRYPYVTFKMGSWNCDGGVVPDALKDLPSYLAQLKYKVRHIPTSSTPYQFGMSLVDAGPMGRLFNEPRSGARSMNAVIQESSISFDLLGSQQSLSQKRFGGDRHFYSVYVEEQSNGRQKLSISASVYGNKEETFEIEIEETL